MKILLIHQNFPGQFRELIPFLRQRGHDLTAIFSHDRPLPQGVKGWHYKAPDPPPVPMETGQHLWFESLQRAYAVAHICSRLNNKGWVPDCIVAHSGWGETLGIKEIWPLVPQIIWPELWTLPHHGGYGVDPLLPSPSLSHHLDQLGRNLMTRASLQQADLWVMPTLHQAKSLPTCFQGHRLNIIHEGINTELAVPNPDISFSVRGFTIDRSVPVITFVNRNLERLRGFDHFMRCLPLLQSRCPELRVFIVGDNEKGYGSSHPSGQPLRNVMLEELSGKLDLDRIYFLGRIPHSYLISLFQVSRIHIYLSYPFVLSWSLLEAMSCGCAIVGSKGLPVSEVIQDGVEGLLVPMDDSDVLVESICTLLSNDDLRSSFASAARLKALTYDIKQTLPKICSLIESYRP